MKTGPDLRKEILKATMSLKVPKSLAHAGMVLEMMLCTLRLIMKCCIHVTSLHRDVMTLNLLCALLCHV